MSKRFGPPSASRARPRRTQNVRFARFYDITGFLCLPKSSGFDPLGLMGRVLGRRGISFYVAFAFTVVAAGELRAQGSPTPTPSPTPASLLINISTRAFGQTAESVVLGGFIVQGMEPKRVFFRVFGPELTQSGVPIVLADPIL